MIPYFSIDTESLGLDAEKAVMIEFAAVYDHGEGPVEKLPAMRKLLKHDLYYGNPWAMAKNAKLLQEIADGSPDLIPAQQLANAFAMFLQVCGVPLNKPIQVAGKNFGKHDLQFLKKLSNFEVPEGIRFHHRVIDPCMLFWEPEHDTELPSMEVCKQRAGIEGDVDHTALPDAIDIVKMVRRAEKRRSLSIYNGDEREHQNA